MNNTIRTKVETYLIERRQAGFQLKTSGLRLQSFARFAARRHHRGPITSRLAVTWAQSSQRRNSRTFADRIEALQPFLKFWNQRDPENELVPSGFFGPGHPRIRPHIYTSKEIRDLVKAASCWPTGSSRAETYATVFGLLAATGLRVSEALKLRRKDVDLDQGILTILETKFKKSRYVILHPTTTRALERYVKRRDEDLANAQSEHFFAISGRRVLIDALERAFDVIRRRLGWRCRGDRPWPRIHDLRYTFICRRLERWYAEGRDVNHLMLSLSTYVGHSMPSSTYWYLTATPKLMALAAHRSGRSRARV
jgi:integrase